MSPQERVDKLLSLLKGGVSIPFQLQDSLLLPLVESRLPPQTTLARSETHQGLLHLRDLLVKLREASIQLALAGSPAAGEALDFLSADDWVVAKRKVASNPELLSEDVLAAVKNAGKYAESAGMPEMARVIAFKARVLERSREIGVDAAFREATSSWISTAKRLQDVSKELLEKPATEVLDDLVSAMLGGVPLYLTSELVTPQLLEETSSRIAEASKTGDSSYSALLRQLEQMLSARYYPESLRLFASSCSEKDLTNIVRNHPRLLSKAAESSLSEKVCQATTPEETTYWSRIGSALEIYRKSGSQAVLGRLREDEHTLLSAWATIYTLAQRVSKGDLDHGISVKEIERITLGLDPLTATHHDLVEAAQSWDAGEQDDSSLEVIKLLSEATRREELSESRPHACIALAGALGRRGQHSEARAVLMAEFARVAIPGDVRGEAPFRLLNANLLMEERLLARAQPEIERAVALFRTVGDQDGLVRALVGSGELYLYLRDPELAVPVLEEALAIIGDDQMHPFLPKTLGALAEASFRLHRSQEAIGGCERELAILRDRGDIPGQVAVLTNLGAYLLDLDHCDEAIHWLTQARDVAESVGNAKAMGSALANLGAAWLEKADSPEAQRVKGGRSAALTTALDLVTQACEILEALNCRDELRQACANRGRIEEALDRTPAASKSYLKSLALAEWQRENLESSRHKQRFQMEFRDVLNRGLHASLSLYEEDPTSTAPLLDAFRFSEASKCRVLLDLAQRAALSSVRPSARINAQTERRHEGQTISSRPDPGARTTAKPVAPIAVGAELPPNTAILQFSWEPRSEECYIRLLVSGCPQHIVEAPARIPEQPIARGLHELNSQIGRLRRQLGRLRELSPVASRGNRESAMQEALTRTREDIDAALETLGSVLLPPDLLGRLDDLGIVRLVVVPEAQLYHVPWSGLRVARPGCAAAYVIEPVGSGLGLEIAVCPSSSAFVHCRSSAKRRSTAPLLADKGSLFVSNPNHNIEHLSLPGVSHHVESLRMALGMEPSVHLAESTATRENLLKHAARSSVVFFFGHGDYCVPDPLDSCLHLHSSSPSPGQETDRLTARDILNWDHRFRLDSCQLFVLGACLAGRMDPLTHWSSLEIQGFAASLFQRGVSALACTLWEALAGPTLLLLHNFLSSYAEGLPASTALRNAQLNFVEHDAWSNPFCWAPFYIFGDYKARP